LLEQATLLVHAWKREDGGAVWQRAITDPAGQPLGCVRLEREPGSSWLSWFRKARLTVLETEDASHLMTVTRAWRVLGIWDVEDAEARHVGTVYSRSIVSSEGNRVALIERDPSVGLRFLGETDQLLGTIAAKDIVELAFAAGDANPFLRMLLLGYAVSLAPLPSR
jgi:hypothetical protein